MKALITGISGFAGSHLAEFLIEKGISQVWCALSLLKEINILEEILIKWQKFIQYNKFKKFEGRI